MPETWVVNHKKSCKLISNSSSIQSRSRRVSSNYQSSRIRDVISKSSSESDSEDCSDSNSDTDIEFVLSSLKKNGVRTSFVKRGSVSQDKKKRIPCSPVLPVNVKINGSVKADARKKLFSDPEVDGKTHEMKGPVKPTTTPSPLKSLTSKESSRSPTPIKKISRRRSSVALDCDVALKKRKIESIAEENCCPTPTTPARKLVDSRTKYASPTQSPSLSLRKRANKRALSEEPENKIVPSLTTPLKRRRSEALKMLQQCTPENKIIQKCETPRTPLEEARVSLHVAAVPETMPCRDQEFENIYSFLKNKLLDGIGGCMYISGVPGTGKTATVTAVVKKLQNAVLSELVPSFKFIEINGMRLTDPRQAYVQLWQGISNRKDRISSEQAQKKLDTYFNKTDSKKVTTVVLVDELDLMCTKKQDVVYNFFDWPSKSNSRLVVLTIANTMDMPERKLKGRVNSRLGLTRLTFLPYTHQQLQTIVLSRLNGSNAFVTDAVALVARKVAAVSGDARRALDICRRATELPAADETVRIGHIEQAIKEMTNSNTVRLIKSCSAVEKYFLRAVSDTSTRTGLEEVDFLPVAEHLITVCCLEGLPKPNMTAILGICYRLKCYRLIYSSNHGGGIMQRITLNITQDDLHYALRVDN